MVPRPTMDGKHGIYRTHRAVARAIYGTTVIVNGWITAMTYSVRRATRLTKIFDWPIPNF